MTDPESPSLADIETVARPVTTPVAMLQGELRKAVVGQDSLLEMLVVALVAGGHVLIEGVPGTAKTLACRALAKAIGVPFARIQFTPDLMPSDIIGTNVFDPASGTFSVRKGPIFAGLVLADEVNRTPPRTQSALLEAMEEGTVTIEGHSFRLPFPFMVCATQNPVEFEGTYPLPEAQQDRFMMKVIVDYPSQTDEAEILQRYDAGFRASDLTTAGISPVLDEQGITTLRQAAAEVSVGASIHTYVVQILRLLRSHRQVLLGPSPRAGVALVMAARALVAVREGQWVTPDEIKTLAPAVLRHRLVLKPEAEMDGVTQDEVIQAALGAVEVPR